MSAYANNEDYHIYRAVVPASAATDRYAQAVEVRWRFGRGGVRRFTYLEVLADWRELANVSIASRILSQITSRVVVSRDKSLRNALFRFIADVRADFP